MTRHVLLSNPLVQIRRQAGSRLMEHLWGHSSRVGLLTGSKNAGTCQLQSGALGVGICAPWSCHFWTWVEVRQGLHQQVCSWFCTSCRPSLMFSWTTAFSAWIEPPWWRCLRWGWGHEGCGELVIVAPSPVWISDVVDEGQTPQMHTLTLFQW